MSTLSELTAYLQSLGIAAFGVDMFAGTLPDMPDKVLVLYEYPGNAPEYVQNSYFPIAEHPQIQIVTRGANYIEASDLIWAVWRALAPITNATLGSTYYRSIRPDGSPALLTHDSNNRPVLFFNAAVAKEVSIAVS